MPWQVPDKDGAREAEGPSGPRHVVQGWVQAVQEERRRKGSRAVHLETDALLQRDRVGVVGPLRGHWNEFVLENNVGHLPPGLGRICFADLADE